MRVVGTRIPTVGEDRKFYSTADSTATAGQTVFAVNYDEGKVAVWLNGIRLVQGQDFTYTASGVGSQITLSSGIVANDYVEVVGYQGIYSGNALVEDRFVVGTSSTGSGGSYTNSTTVFPVASNTGDLVCVYRNGIKLVHTTDFTVDASASTVTLQSASNTADEITVHVIGILQHSNFVSVTGGTFTGTVAHTGTLDVSGGTLTTSTAQKTAIVDGGKGNLTKSDVGLSNVTNDAQVPASGGTFSGDVTVNVSSTSDALRVTQTGTGNALVVEDSTNPDSTPFVVNSAGEMTAHSNVNFNTKADNQYSFSTFWNKSRGTADTPTIVQNGDTLGNLYFKGYDGTNYTLSAGIIAQVDGTPGTNDMPGRLVFSTTADGASSPTERMRIDSSGRVTMPYQPAFQVAMSAAGYRPSTNADIEFSIIKLNNGNHYNNSTYRFTAPIAGIYFFNYNILWRANSNPSYAETTLAVNGSKPNSNSRGTNYQQDPDTSAHDTMSASYIVSLIAGDYVSVRNVYIGGNSDYYGNNGLSTFCGYLLA